MAGELAALTGEASVLIVGAASGEVPAGRDRDRLPPDATPEDLEGLGIYDLVIVLGLTGPPAPLLGRLRDLHARRMLVAGKAAEERERGEMLALGFERHPGEGGAGPLYVYDQDTFNRQREWNTPENWANPENFDKYRW